MQVAAHKVALLISVANQKKSLVGANSVLLNTSDKDRLEVEFDLGRI